MSQEQWTAVDGYINDSLVAPDPALSEAVRASAAAGLPPIAVSPNQGKLLHLLARASGRGRFWRSARWAATARSGWRGRCRPGGRLITLEADPKHAEVARANIARAGLADVVELRVGARWTRCRNSPPRGAGPFDLIFIDADKRSKPEYFDWSLDSPGAAA